jgi:hypothetical protein
MSVNIEQELELWLNANLADTDLKRRDFEVVMTYYGFRKLVYPSIEEVAGEFQFSNYQRVQQIIKEKFKSKATIEQLPTVRRATGIIDGFDCILTTKLKEILATDAVISRNTSLKDVLRLSRHLSCLLDFELYNGSMRELSGTEDECHSFLARKSNKAALAARLKKAKSLPGSLGLAKFDYLRAELGDGTDTEELIQFIRDWPDACVADFDGNEWYVIETRDQGYFINSCEKILNLGESFDLIKLADVLANSLYRRTPFYQSKGYAYPGAQAISAWIVRSKWFDVEGSIARFKGRKSELPAIEADLISYLREVKVSSFSDCRNYLKAKGHGKDNIVKAVQKSPLVLVDKSAGRTKHLYKLLDLVVPCPSTTPVDRKRRYEKRLKEMLCRKGTTDSSRESFERNEQQILREYLFENLAECECAICGEIFSVSALVAAHKKKRAICTDLERTDLSIVFPLCKFGCDYLYEEGLIRVVGGKLKAVVSSNDNIETKRAKFLEGRRISEKWISSDPPYFS